MTHRSINTRTEINVPLETAWKTLSDLNSMHTWNQWLKVDAPKETKPGTKIRIALTPTLAEGGKPQTMAFEPQVLNFGETMTAAASASGAGPASPAPNPASSKELRWRGKLFNSDWFFVGEHYFTLHAAPGGRSTILTHGEEFKGLLIPLMGGLLNETQKEFKAFNQCLKDRCEGREPP